MARAIVIPADLDEPLRLVDLTTLADYQHEVRGHIEQVPLDNGLSLYVNECGKFSNLRFNRRASLHWWYRVPILATDDYIRGNAILVGPADDEGNTLDLPESSVTLLLGTPRYTVLPSSPCVAPEEFTDYFEAIGSALDEYMMHDGRIEYRVVPMAA